MNKLTAILCATALVSFLPAAPALAEGATVTTEGLCFGFIPTAEGGTSEDFLTGTLHSVVTKNGSTSLVCKFTFDAGIIETARRASDFLCFTFAGSTTDTRMVASPDGYATLHCRINASKPV
jgi:hypothetical protein